MTPRVGTIRTTTTRGARSSPRWASAAVPTSVSACTSPGPRCRVGIGALLDRLPNLRLDPDAEPPEAIGFYERGVMEIPVVFG